MFDRLKKVTPRAFNALDRAMGRQTDDDLRLYESLQPDDFKMISKQYGADGTLEYIQEMERRRLKGGTDV